MRAGFCNRCQGWLGTISEINASRGTETKEELSGHASIALMIGNMLAAAPLLTSSISKEQLASAISKQINQLPPYYLKDLAKIIEVRANVISNLVRSNHKVKLNILVRMCKAFGLSILDFLNGKEADAAALTWVVPPRIRTKAQLTSLLQTALHDPTYPSITELSRQFGYKSPNSLRAASPEICKEITAKNKENAPDTHNSSTTAYHLDHVSTILSEALREVPPPTVKEVSSRAGYGYEVHFRGKYPEITKSLMERRAEYIKAECSVIEEALLSALKEEPPPNLVEVGPKLDFV
jgi:plasmid maintenance system antidote protein VapI